MTVQEFYDDMIRQQAAQKSSKFIHVSYKIVELFLSDMFFQAQPTPTVQSTSLSDEQRNEIDDPAYRENVRRMDEFKDENPRGSGNRYNRS